MNAPRASQSMISPVELVELAAAQVLREDAAIDALPTFLGLLAAAFGCHAALAFQEDARQRMVVLAAHPGDAGADLALHAEVRALSAQHRQVAATGGSFVARLASDRPPGGRPDGRPESVLLAYSAPDSGRCLCAVALVGDSARWTADSHAAARALAAIVAGQIRHANSRAELAERQLYTSALVAGSPDAIIVADAAGRLMVFNRAAEELTGWRRDDVLGKPMPEVIIPEQDRPAVTGGLQTYLASGDGGAFVDRMHLPILRADGTQITVELTPVPITIGGEVHFCAFLRDISDHKRAEAEREGLLTAERAAGRDLANQTERLSSLNAKLQELDEANTQFLATMSHEVRTPLTSIVSFTELILDDEAQALTPDTASSLSVIQRNAQRLLGLVGDLLLLSRLESGVVPLDLAAVSLPDLIGEVARSASAGAAERGITLQVSAMAGPPIQAELLRIEEVFDNLLANAIKFSGPAGQVRVTATHDEKMWRVVVADDGIGIPADELGSLFGRFVRASNARVAGLPGSGLGLSVVKAITELHGGSVLVQSTVGIGTTFTVCLPVGDERQGA